MAEYRVYVVGRDGHFLGCEPLVCGDDVETIQKANRLVDANDVELWCGERLVIRLSSTSPGAAPINPRKGLRNSNNFAAPASYLDGERRGPEAARPPSSREGQ